MASAKALVLPGVNSSLKKPKPLDTLVAPRERIEVPNHLLDTSLFLLLYFSFDFLYAI